MERIAIIGTRGIPASYSGFETSVEETSVRFVENGYEVTVFCRSTHYQVRLKTYKGVQLKYITSINSKHLDTITNTLFSMLAVAKCKYDIIILYGLGNAYLIPVIKLFCKNIISVVDGADWERAKWGKFAKLVLRNGRTLAVNYSSFYVVDNELLSNNYKKAFKKEPIYIPYGANIPNSFNNKYLKKHNLEEGRYIIFIGRFVKEKGIDFLLDNFSKIVTNMKLIIVGGNASDPKYENILRTYADQRIIFLGFVFGEEYESLLRYAKFYISCSFLEGTSPSLLSAMAINGFAFVSDLPENIEVLKGTCKTFRSGDSKDFKNKLEPLLNGSIDIDSEREKTFSIIKQYYMWDKIAEQYIELFKKISLNK